MTSGMGFKSNGTGRPETPMEGLIDKYVVVVGPIQTYYVGTLTQFDYVPGGFCLLLSDARVVTYGGRLTGFHRLLHSTRAEVRRFYDFARTGVLPAMARARISGELPKIVVTGALEVVHASPVAALTIKSAPDGRIPNKALEEALPRETPSA